MNFLNKNEIAHTTNLGFLRELCILVGNTTLSKLDKSKRTNYGSEQTMEELVRAIGVTLEEDILNEVRLSAYYGIIIDDATDIATSKAQHTRGNMLNATLKQHVVFDMLPRVS